MPLHICERCSHKSPYQVINLGLVFVGSQTECERFLDKLDESLLSDRFDKLKGQVFDVGTVLEETQEGSEEQELPACFPRENFDKVKGRCLAGRLWLLPVYKKLFNYCSRINWVRVVASALLSQVKMKQ